MEHLLDNPVFNALLSGDTIKALGSDNVKYFDKEVSPFAGFKEKYTTGFKELYQLLPGGRYILYATRKIISEPAGWQLIQHISGTQFLYSSGNRFENNFAGIIPLQLEHVDQMVGLAALTKPGPFNSRTIEFGNYHGIFENDKLVAMTGQRLHVYHFTEVSAVCTHPDHLGKGYAGMLLKHQVNIILNDEKIPFLHVRSDNERAISLYERSGFKKNGEMNFYFMQRKN